MKEKIYLNDDVYLKQRRQFVDNNKVERSYYYAKYI